MNPSVENSIEKSELEKRADISIEKALEIIKENIPVGEVQCVYVKGSYVQHEMNEKSDVDIFIILKSNKYLIRITF